MRVIKLIFVCLSFLALQSCILLLPVFEEDNASVYKSNSIKRSNIRGGKVVVRLPVIQRKLLDKSYMDKASLRAQAATKMGDYPQLAGAFVPRLSSLLRTDSSKWVRRAAARSLGKMGTSASAQALIAGTKDSDRYVRHSSKNALNKIR